MSSATKRFNIIIDVAALRANTVHTTNVDLVEDGTSQRLVTIPITVVKEREFIFRSLLYENRQIGDVLIFFVVNPKRARL